MDCIQPYLKYVLYLVAIVGLLWTNRIFLQDPELRKWLLQSFEDPTTHKTSGKSLSAFFCTTALVIGWFIAIHYAPHHIAPEYFFWGLISLVAGLYGIKEVGKVMTKTPNGNGLSSSDQVDPEADLRKKWKESGSALSFEEWKSQTQ